MKHNFTHFPLSHAERKKCRDFFSENTNSFIKMSFQEWLEHQLREWLKSNNFLEHIKTFQAKFLDLFLAVTVLLHFLAYVPISEHAPLLGNRRTEVNCNIYNIGESAFSINSQNVVFHL